MCIRQDRIYYELVVGVGIRWHEERLPVPVPSWISGHVHWSHVIGNPRCPSKLEVAVSSCNHIHPNYSNVLEIYSDISWQTRQQHNHISVYSNINKSASARANMSHRRTVNGDKSLHRCSLKIKRCMNTFITILINAFNATILLSGNEMLFFHLSHIFTVWSKFGGCITQYNVMVPSGIKLDFRHNFPCLLFITVIDIGLAPKWKEKKILLKPMMAQLIHWGRVLQTCINKLGHHWFR